MKLLSPLLCLALFCACTHPSPEIPKTLILPETLGPPKVLDSQVRLSREGSLEVLKEGFWIPLTGKDFPTRVLWPEKTPIQRPLTSFNNSTAGTWTMTTPFEGFVSRDQGLSWEKVLVRETFAKGAYLTALAASPTEGLFAAGTSFSGWFLTSDGGKKWQKVPDLTSAYNYADGTHETVNALVFSQTQPSTLYASVGKEGEKIFRYSLPADSKTKPLVTEIAFPGGAYLQVPEALAVHSEGDQEILEVRTRSAYWRYETVTQKWLKLEDREMPVWDADKLKRMQASKDKYGFYINPHQAAVPEALQSHLDFMTKNGLNAVVIDFKNDFGEVNYASEVPFAQKIGSVKPLFDAKEVIQKVHDRGFYLIARLVVFKDNRLYKYNNFQYALYDSSTKKPWGNVITTTNDDGTETSVQKEFWVDTYSEDVWNYNIALAKELEGLGVDEVQFDYIRFPSDGPVSRIVNRFKVDGMSRMDALESFLRAARAEIKIPLSVDIYGFNGYFMTDYLGQNMGMISRYVDAISPMFYPSHFWRAFLKDTEYFERAKIIYNDGGDRTFLNTDRRIHVRPWVQSFLIGGETKFATPQFVTYLDKELEGVQKSAASGLLLWNASNKYYMITKPITPWVKATQLPY